MGMEVYANGMSIACKAADGKTVAAMPDVCLSPPTPPAGPVPIPYPNTAMASDTDQGTKTVQIGGQEVMMKDSSTFKKSSGDEAATKSLGMGVVTACIQGEVTFVAWSMDVKFEGANVPRNLDLTLHNEQSVPANTPTWPYLDAAAMGSDTHPCAEDKAAEQTACKEYKPNGSKDPCKEAGAIKKPSRKKSSKTASNMADRTTANDCLNARRCSLQPYDPNGCCPGQTPHHLVEASAFHDKGRGGKGSNPLKGISGYNEGKAPCVCAEGPTQNVGTHGLMHTFQSAAASKAKDGTLELANGKSITAPAQSYGKARDNGVAALQRTFPEAGCNPSCIKAQLDAYHNQCGIKSRTKIKAVETGSSSDEAVAAADDEVAMRTQRVFESRGDGVAGSD